MAITTSVGTFETQAVASNSPKDLPSEPGVYFLVNTNNTPLYIGQSKDLRTRWCSHTLRDTASKLEDGKIIFALVPVEHLDVVEWEMLGKFDPPFNKKKPRTSNIIPGTPEAAHLIMMATQDHRLSHKAIGILVALIHNPYMTVGELRYAHSEGAAAIKSGMQELVQLRYITRTNGPYNTSTIFALSAEEIHGYQGQ